jgi:adenylate kinase
MRHRIEEFEKQTPPLLEYYDRREVLLRIDGSRPIDEVSATVIGELARVRQTLQ